MPHPAPLLAALAALLLAACATAPTTRGMPDEARHAEQLYRDGDFDAAARAFLDAAAGSRAQRDLYRLRAAEAWREEGDLAAAERALAQVGVRGLDDDGRQRLFLLQAELALANNAPRLALDRLAHAAPRAPAQRARMHELRGRAFEAEGDRFAAAAEYAALEPLLAEHERRANAERIQALLAASSDRALVRGSSELSAGHPLASHAARALQLRGLALPDRLSARPDFERRPPPGMLPVPRVVGLVLPEQGPLRLASQSVRDGFMAAYFAADGARPEIRSYDAGQTPDEAVEAYRRAVAEGAEVVVGPLSREAVTAVLSAPRLPVPVVALNRPAGPLPPGSISFALAPEDEAAAVAERVAERGLRRVLAVAAADDGAQRALAGFTARHLQAGGSLIGTIVVPEAGVDYLDQIRRTLSGAGLPTSAPRDLSIPHDPGFDAVFLALRPQHARLAVPQLRMVGITRLPIFATSSINAVDDGNRLDRDLNGIEFSEVPWLVTDLPGMPRRTTLASTLDSARGPAARLFAFGYDAYRLMLHRAVLEHGERMLDGATGRITLDRLGETRRTPGIAVFRNQRAVLADGAAGLLTDGESAR